MFQGKLLKTTLNLHDFVPRKTVLRIDQNVQIRVPASDRCTCIPAARYDTHYPPQEPTAQPTEDPSEELSEEPTAPYIETGHFDQFLGQFLVGTEQA